MRPENWETLKAKRHPLHCYFPDDCVGQSFEAGADAYEEALKKEAIHIKTTYGWEHLKEIYEDWLHGNKTGYIVFIPD